MLSACYGRPNAVSRWLIAVILFLSILLTEKSGQKKSGTLDVWRSGAMGERWMLEVLANQSVTWLISAPS